MESPDMIYADLCDADSVNSVDIPDEIINGIDDDDIDLFCDIKSEECNMLEEGEFIPGANVVQPNFQETPQVQVNVPKKNYPTNKQNANKKPKFCHVLKKHEKRNAMFLQKNSERKRKAALAFQEKVAFQEKQRYGILDRQVVEISRALYAVFPGIGCDIDKFAEAIRNSMIGENFGPDFIARSALQLHRISGALLQLPDIVRYLR